MDEKDIWKMVEDGTADQIIIRFEDGITIKAKNMNELREKIGEKKGKVIGFGIGVPGGSVGRK